MNKIIGIALLGRWSCKTYTKSTCITIVDRYDYKISVWDTYRYDRKTDTLIRHSIDTVVTIKHDDSNGIMQQSMNQIFYQAQTKNEYNTT